MLALTSCNTSNIMYYSVILCHKLVFLVLVRLIAIKSFNRIAALILTPNVENVRGQSRRCILAGSYTPVPDPTQAPHSETPGFTSVKPLAAMCYDHFLDLRVLHQFTSRSKIFLRPSSNLFSYNDRKLLIMTIILITVINKVTDLNTATVITT